MLCCSYFGSVVHVNMCSLIRNMTVDVAVLCFVQIHLELDSLQLIVKLEGQLMFLKL